MPAPRSYAPPLRLVIVESPFAGDRARNRAYLALAMRDCLARREAPFASHGLYTQPGILDDNRPADRKLGIEAGFAWGAQAQATVVYQDLGISSGMKLGIAQAERDNRPIEYRFLPPNQLRGIPESPHAMVAERAYNRSLATPGFKLGNAHTPAFSELPKAFRDNWTILAKIFAKELGL